MDPERLALSVIVVALRNDDTAAMIEWLAAQPHKNAELVLVDEGYEVRKDAIAAHATKRGVNVRHVGVGNSDVRKIGYDAGVITSTGDVCIFANAADLTALDLAQHARFHAIDSNQDKELRTGSALSVQRERAVAARMDKIEDDPSVGRVVESKRLRVAMIYGEFSSAIHGPFDIEGLYTRRGLTGSESSFFNLARTLAERGHEVVVFCKCEAEVDHPSGFKALPIRALEHFPKVEGVDAVIAWNEPDYLKYAPAGAKRYCDQQLNDFGYCRESNWKDLVDVWVSPSDNHRDNVMAQDGLDLRTKVIPNSVDLDLFNDAPERHPHRVVWCSSPDRGLHHLLSMWPEVRKRVPDAELRVFYRLTPWLNMMREHPEETGRRARYIESVLPRLAPLGVTVMDQVPNAQMARELQSAACLAYPCDPMRYTEGFGVSVLDAAAAGCVPIISAADALPEVHGNASIGVPGPPEQQRESWVGAICAVLLGQVPQEGRDKMKQHAARHSRQKVADQWEALLLDRPQTVALTYGEIRSKTVDGHPFKFATLQGHGDNDHASWWSFDDEQEVRDRHWHMKPGDVVLDIGCAFGSYALPALAMGAKVIAFNPGELDAQLMAKNVSLNPDFPERFAQYRDGIGACDGWFDMKGSRFASAPDEKGEWIKVRSLDSWMTEHPEIDRINWIKMDIEGAELDALKGAEKTIRKFKPKFSIENHQFHHPTMERDVRDFLVGLGVGYVCDGPYPYHSVSHSFFEVK